MPFRLYVEMKVLSLLCLWRGHKPDFVVLGDGMLCLACDQGPPSVRPIWSPIRA